jgi:alkane 1-monooxygenase
MMARTYADASGTPVEWKDSKRHLWVLGLVVPLLPLVGLALHREFGWAIFMWFTPIAMYGIIPVIDLFAGNDKANAPEEIIASLEKDPYYRWILYAYIPVQYFTFFLGMYLIAKCDLTLIVRIGLAVSVGNVVGIAINTAHELGHKREELERWASKITLAQCFYGHFFIEHNRGHHVRVATPEDPASARLGETFYRFWPRTVWGSLKSAWRLEKARYQRKGQHPYRIGNHVLNSWLMSVVLWGGVIAWLGWGMLPYLVLAALVSYTLLEVVNYMEHYGMLRQEVGTDGAKRFERVQPSHSWNSNNVATNVLLYHLQRHSDHHANPTRRYQALRDFPEAPVLPTGYTGMIVMAWIPFLFRALMDKRVYDHYDGDITLANIDPRKRAKYLKKFPPPVGVTHAMAADATAHEFSGVVSAARCPGCGHTYRVADGNKDEGFAPGTAWASIPDTWCCPDCGVREKIDFIPLVDVEV